MHRYTLIVLNALITTVLVSVPVNASLNTIVETELINKLHQAAQNGNFECIPALLNDCRFLKNDTTNYDMRSQALLTAIEQVNEASIKVLLQYGIINWQDIDNNTALHVALVHRHASIAELLLLSGANVNLQDNKGNTPLHLAVANNDIELVKLLLVYGASLDIPNNMGVTPLQWTRDIRYKNLDIRLLLTLYKATLTYNLYNS